MKMLFLLASLGAASVPAWQAPLEIAAGRGDKGPWRQNDSRYDYVDDATVASVPGGGHLVAWVDQKGKDVWLRRVGADGKPDAAVNVSRSPATFSWLPRIAVDPARGGRVYLLWQEIIFSGGSHGGDILFAASIDGGKTFAAPLNLSRSQGGDGKGRLDRRTWSNGSLDLAVGADGTLFAAWTEYQGALWLARSFDGGRTFSAPRRIAGDDARPARAPSLALGPARGVYLAWSVGEDPQAAIRVVASRDNGARFAAPQSVGVGEGLLDAPQLAFASGRLHLVYARQRAPGAPSEIRYASAADGRFGAARTLSAGGAAYPMLAADGADGLAVAWENISADGRAQSLGFVRSVDAGRNFSAPSVVPGSAAPPGGSNGSQQGLLGQKLALGSDGRIALVNSSLLPGVRSRIWLMRGTGR